MFAPQPRMAIDIGKPWKGRKDRQVVKHYQYVQLDQKVPLTLWLEEEHKKDADAAKLRAEEAFLKPLWPESSATLVL